MGSQVYLTESVYKVVLQRSRGKEMMHRFLALGFGPRPLFRPLEIKVQGSGFGVQGSGFGVESWVFGV